MSDQGFLGQWDGRLNPSTDELDRSVHIWLARSGQEDRDLAPLEALLSADEQARAGRFRVEHVKKQYVLARALLRAVLGRYLGRPGNELQFVYGAQGKPSLFARPNEPDVQLNVSHSRDLVLIGLTLGRQIGVDVEYRDPELDGEQIAESFFSPEEKAALRALPEGDRRDAFFACWTRKEAYLKARGIGLTRALEQFTVSVSPEEPAALLATYDDPSQAGRWSLADLSVPGDYAAAVAVEGPPGDLDYFRVPPGW